MSLWLRSKKCGVTHDGKRSSRIHFHLDRRTVDAHCHGHWLTVMVIGSLLRFCMRSIGRPYSLGVNSDTPPVAALIGLDLLSFILRLHADAICPVL